LDLPVTTVARVNKRLYGRVARFSLTRIGAVAAGRLMPYGVGAVIGYTGGRELGRIVVAGSRRRSGGRPGPIGSSGPASPSRGAMVHTGYEDLLRDVLTSGTPKSDRTGTGTRSIFGHQLRYDLSEGFPLITTKRV